MLSNLSSGEPKDNYAQSWSKYVMQLRSTRLKVKNTQRKRQKHSILAEESANIKNENNLAETYSRRIG